MDMNIKRALMNLISQMGGKGGELDVEMSMGGESSMLGNNPEMVSPEGESSDQAPKLDMKSMLGGGVMGRSPNSLREKALSKMK